MRKYLLIGLLFVFTGSSFAQSRKIDSLKNILRSNKTADTARLNTLVLLSEKLRKAGMFDSSMMCARSAVVLAEKLSSSTSSIIFKLAKEGLTKSYGNIGVVYREKGDYPNALEYDDKMLKVAEELGDKQLEAIATVNLGNVSYVQGNFTKTLEYYFMTLKTGEEIAKSTDSAKIKAGLKVQANTTGNIGNVYRVQGNYPKALEYYFKALKMSEELKDKVYQANNTANIANVYSDQQNYAKALEYDLKALKMVEEIGDKQMLEIVTGNVGSVYYSRADYANAFVYLIKSLNMAEEIGDKYGQAYNQGIIGGLYIKTGKFKEAEEYLKKAIAIDSATGDLNSLSQFEGLLSQLYDTTRLYKPALVWYKKAMVIKDTLFNIDKNKAFTRKELTYEFDKKQAAQKAEQDKKDALALADKRKQTIVIWSTIAGLLLVLVFAGFIFRSLRVTRKQKKIIEVKNIETEKQKALIEQQKLVVEEKNKDILDSINYAKRLQEAILPPLSLIKQTLPESFVLYKPKDIVAGDFYWLGGATSLNLSQGRDLKDGAPILVAAADCTGHGVPGALVSVVCSNALNRTVKEFKITEPGKILDKVRELVLETFEKSEDNVQDGMDISLIALTLLSPKGESVTDANMGSSPTVATYDASLPLGRDSERAVRVQWSGAFNSLWYIQNGEMKELPADKQPIGKTDNPKPFTTHNLTLQKGDTLYLFTDGYADQFGGPKGKKFKYAQFQEKLLAISNKPLAEQKNILEQTFDQWKGDLEQIDDVLVIGIRV